MRLTPHSCRPYICLFCRIVRFQRVGADQRTYSLLATSTSQNDSTPPPGFDSATAKNLFSNSVDKTSQTAVQNAAPATIKSSKKNVKTSASKKAAKKRNLSAAVKGKKTTRAQKKAVIRKVRGSTSAQPQGKIVSPDGRAERKIEREILEKQQVRRDSTARKSDKHPQLTNKAKIRLTQKTSTANDEEKGIERVASQKLTTSATPTKTESGPQSLSSQSTQDTISQASLNSHTISAGPLDLVPVQTKQPSIPTLTHDLQRVLFNPGIYQLQDPRSRVYNFDPYLKSIMPVTDFDFTALKNYKTSSQDDTLRQLGINLGKKYLGSSSNMTLVLSHFHYLLSSWREVNISTVSRSFPEKLTTFVQTQRAPAAVFLRHRDGMYAIDADKGFDTQNILMGLGRSLEKLLTSSREKFELYRRSSEEKISEDERNTPEAYHYSQLGDFLMRSQLDAQDARLPGSGVFDLKTRAVVSIRMNSQNFEEGVGYQIRDRFGQFESYEREFYDMIRSAFLKYSLQVRMGNMDGIFVAYHNIESLFGFQYISLPEMDLAIHGQSEASLGDQEFKLSLKLWNQILDRVTAKFPGRSLRIHFEARESKVRPFMYVFAEPLEENQIERMQARKAGAWQDFIEDLRQRAIIHPEDEEPLESDSNPASADADKSFLDQISRAETGPEAGESSSPSDAGSAQPSRSELCCLLVTVQNRVNGVPVKRPTNLSSSDEWMLDVDLTEVTDKRTHQLYDACQKRRRALLDSDLRSDITARGYAERLRDLTKKGRAWQQAQNELDSKQKPVILYRPGQ